MFRRVMQHRALVPGRQVRGTATSPDFGIYDGRLLFVVPAVLIVVSDVLFQGDKARDKERSTLLPAAAFGSLGRMILCPWV